MAFAFNTPGAATPAVQQADGTNQEVCLRAGAGSESAVDATGHRAQRRSRVSRDPRAGIGQRAFAVWAGLALATSRAVALPGAAPPDSISPEILSLLRANQELFARTTDFASRALQDPDAIDVVAEYDALAKDSLDLAKATVRAYPPGP